MALAIADEDAMGLSAFNSNSGIIRFRNNPIQE